MLPKLPNHKIFKNAPIKEAIIGISTLPLDEKELPKLEALKNIFPEYPTQRPLHLMKFTGSVNNEGVNNASAESSLMGYQFLAADESELITCWREGFSYHKLKPYTEWQVVLPKAVEGWAKFCKAINPAVITRLTVRNINLIEIPHPMFDLDEYFQAGPKLPQGVEGPIENFFSRMTIDFPEYNTKCNVTFAQQPPQAQEHSSIVFDIEAFNIIKGQLSVAKINDMLTTLNYTKDMVFFGNITEKTTELFA